MITAAKYRITLYKPYDRGFMLRIDMRRVSPDNREILEAFDQAVLDAEWELLPTRPMFNQIGHGNIDMVSGWEYLYFRDEDSILAHALRVGEILGCTVYVGEYIA